MCIILYGEYISYTDTTNACLTCIIISSACKFLHESTLFLVPRDHRVLCGPLHHTAGVLPGAVNISVLTTRRTRIGSAHDQHLEPAGRLTRAGEHRACFCQRQQDDHRTWQHRKSKVDEG